MVAPAPGPGTRHPAPSPPLSASSGAWRPSVRPRRAGPGGATSRGSGGSSAARSACGRSRRATHRAGRPPGPRHGGPRAAAGRRVPRSTAPTPHRRRPAAGTVPRCSAARMRRSADRPARRRCRGRAPARHAPTAIRHAVRAVRRPGGAPGPRGAGPRRHGTAPGPRSASRPRSPGPCVPARRRRSRCVPPPPRAGRRSRRSPGARR